MRARYSRRRTLAAGAALVTGSVVAGCLSDDEGPESSGTGTGTGTETGTGSTPLGIDHLRLLTEKPADYREYDPNADATYPADAVVWLYFEPAGVATADAGAGEERIDLTSTLTVTGPDGRERTTSEERFDREIPEGGLEELYIYFQFTPESPADPGEYTADLSLRDELAGERVEESVSFTMAPPETPSRDFAVEHVRFLAEEPAGYREYTPVEDATYGPDDDVWIYLEPKGFGIDSRDGDERRIDLSLRVHTTDPDGEERTAVRKDIERALPEDRDRDEVYLAAKFGLVRPTVGEYDVEIELHDRVRRADASATGSFTVEDEDLALVEAFRDAIETDSEVDVEIERLSLREMTLHLSYTTDHAYGEDEFAGDVGFVAGAYAAVVDEGLSAEQLRATGEDAEAQEFAYRIDSDVAQQYMDREITEDEYVEHVMSSLHVRG